jgi:hypothetical protein
MVFIYVLVESGAERYVGPYTGDPLVDAAFNLKAICEREKRRGKSRTAVRTRARASTVSGLKFSS